ASTPWAQEKLFQVLNHRFIRRLPTVVTLATPLGLLEPRVQSRLADPEVSRVCAVAAEAGRWGGTGALDLPRFREMTFQTLQPRRSDLSPDQRENLERICQIAKAYAERPDGWLVLVGEHGVGKTHLAVAIAHACRERGMGVLFLVVPDLLDHLRYTFRPESDVSYDQLFEEVKRVPLLVLDDLGAHATSPWAQEKLYQIINYRYNAQLPLVVTTNLPLDELERAETRIASRLADTRFSVVFHMDASDYRVDRPTSASGPHWAAPRAAGRGRLPAAGQMDKRRPPG
ncbi:MAG: ATP-binding protein, partial [Chloroflexi bacterium]|nr:ATP-binding protein [Chloroflexota bacterium]